MNSAELWMICRGDLEDISEYITYQNEFVSVLPLPDTSGREQGLNLSEVIRAK